MKIGTFDITPRQEYITEVRRYELITPLFGGGVMPQQPDPISIIRATSVRGQLRFWWRATRGGQFVSIEELRKAEEVLWGGATVLDKDGKRQSGGPGLVQVEVSIVHKGSRVEMITGARNSQVHFGHPDSPISYGAFPLREQGSLQFGVQFELRITYPIRNTIRDDLAATCWAWETFGGVGGRTRRGFGAICCTEAYSNNVPLPVSAPKTAKAQDVLEWLQKSSRAHVITGVWPSGIPHLTHTTTSVVCRHSQGFSIRVGRDDRQFADVAKDILRQASLANCNNIDQLVSAMVAWYAPIFKLQNFRQNSRRKSSTGTRFGRSHWPEPDEIRARTVGFRGRHSQRLSVVHKFPRAAFGLPIVFQFKDQAIDPPETTLQGANHARYTSRLVLRPIACADGQFVGIATVLEGPSVPPKGLKLIGDTTNQPIDITPLTPQEAAFMPMNDKTDVLRAFLDTL